MTKPRIKMVVPDDLASKITTPEDEIDEFLTTFTPVESVDVLHVFVDARTLAFYSECHIFGDKIVCFAPADVPLDPEEQPEYRANREMVADHTAFSAMKEDAKKRRSFSNIVAEFTTAFDEAHLLKIIGA